MRLRASVVVAAACFAALGPPGVAAGAEWPTPQAQLSNAEFLATAPAPDAGAAAVCVIDTGVDMTTDVAPAVKQRLALDGGTGDDLGGREDLDQPKHGTYVAGAIASQIDGRGSSGLWPRARIVSVRVFPGGGGGVAANDYIGGINLCSSSGETVKVINLSLGGFDANDPNIDNLRDRISTARSRGISVVAGAGNEGGTVTGPGAFASAVTVGAGRPSGARCTFSNTGPAVDLLATGCAADGLGAFNELTFLDGGLARAWGTSYSAPLVSAALAALRSYRPATSAPEAEQLLLEHTSAGPNGRRLDVAAAFRAAGLGPLVAAYAPPPSAGGGGPAAAKSPTTTETPGPVSADTVAAPPAVTPVPAPVAAPPRVRRRPSKPRLDHLRYRGGVLDVRVRGLTAAQKAVFMLDARRFVRSDGRLRVRVRRWRVLRVVARDRDGRRSPELVLRRALTR